MRLVQYAPEACEACPYIDSRTHITSDEVGDKYTGVMIIGEAPGVNEDRAGRPFVGESGVWLEALLDVAGLTKEDCYITNVCRCRPPGNKITAKGIRFHRQFVEAAIQEAKPSLVIAIGASALHHFRLTPPLTTCHGKPFKVGDIVVFPTFHPAYAMRNPGVWPLLYADFAAIGTPTIEPITTHYVQGTDREAAIISQAYSKIGFDIETTDELYEGIFYPHLQKILGYSISWAPGEAMWVMGEPEEMRGVLEDERIVKVCHNAKFEYQVLLNHGIVLRGFEDTKIKAYLLQYPSTALKTLSYQVLDVRQKTLEEVTRGRPTREVAAEEWLEYAPADADVTLRLDAVLDRRLKDEGLEGVYRRFELPLVGIL